MPTTEKKTIPVRIVGKLTEDYEVPDNLTILEEEDVPADCGIFRIMTEEGDTRIVWNKFSIAEINDAQKAFQELIAKGMMPYKVGVDGKPSSEEMKEFDPTAEEVVFLPMPMLAGG